MLIACFAAVYVIWGSTYFAIAYAVQTIPPWTMSSGRFFIASALMFVLALFLREKKMGREERYYAGLSGVFLIFANGVVGMVEKNVSSGLVAVLVGAMPIWVMLVGWVAFGQSRPTIQKIIGALIGLSGVVLIAAGATGSGAASDKWSVLILFGSSLSWTVGTLLQRKAPPVQSPLRFTAFQMCTGAIGTTLMSVAFEKPWQLSLSTITWQSWTAAIYLVVFGSMVAFTAYSWLSRHVEPHIVSTYALVNPVIAVWLGWFFLSEPVNSNFFFATILVLFGLSLLIFKGNPLRVPLAGFINRGKNPG